MAQPTLHYERGGVRSLQGMGHDPLDAGCGGDHPDEHQPVGVGIRLDERAPMGGLSVAARVGHQASYPEDAENVAGVQQQFAGLEFALMPAFRS
ncbi:hypothetical protein U2F26_27350 [Micromonospora sp. 4G57]|uniref:Uncharacterized protein n=1 Tax=Micromonospora sicca TaxID=2202420 RepID=A0ABU5JL97_9ACTN|nr:hypothetical protein [Micromonospora sp. 4G57]MDZ5446406.1 hypothetical protein [Micromonospora sp. 4G57]MDZ5493405.1 hypothetical protein [Micromonospora sp. 4G53]